MAKDSDPLCLVHQDGELPVEMMPQHHDDPFADDDGEGNESDGEPEAGPDSSSVAQPSGQPPMKVKLPLKLGSNLTGATCMLLACLAALAA